MVTRTKKIFVGGLSAPTTLEDVKNYFEQFGWVRLSTVQPYNTAGVEDSILFLTFSFSIIVKLRRGSGKDRQGMAPKAKGLKA